MTKTPLELAQELFDEIGKYFIAYMTSNDNSFQDIDERVKGLCADLIQKLQDAEKK